MTTQTVHIQTFDYGASLTSATLRAIDTDTLVATADTTDEVTADSGLYAAVFGEVVVITAGTYRLRAVAGGQPINRYVTLAGVDAEVVQSRSERFAELPPDGITASVLAADAVNEIADGVWDETTAGHTASGTYGGRIVRSTNSNVEVQITGSHHVAADVHELQTGVIVAGAFAADSLTAAALAADAVTEIQSGLATAAALATAQADIDIITGTDGVNLLSATQTQITTIAADVVNIDGAAMRGTDNAALAATALSTAVWTNTLATNIGTTNTTVASIGATGTGLTAIPWNAAWDAEVQSEVQDAIEFNHLDHLLAVDYDPASKPGVATSLLNELIGNDLGVSQFTANALELAPTGGSAPTVEQIADEVQTRTIAAVTLVNGLAADSLTAAALSADAVTEIQSGLATSAAVAAEAVKTANILDGVAWILADATGAIAAPQSATATAILTTFGATYTVQYAGLTSTGVRTAPTLSKV